MKKKTIPILTVCALIVIIVAIIGGSVLLRKYSPSKEHKDLTSYYNITADNQVAIVLNNELTSSYATLIDGHIYVDYNFVHDTLNSRFYWDHNENILLYATSRDLISAEADSNKYLITKSSVDYGRPVVKANSDSAYIDLDFVKEYTDKIDYGKSPLEYLKENRGFIKEKDDEIQISTAAILLFGKNPQNFFPRARIRFIRYEGTEEKFGTEMNVIKDVIFEGTLLNMINEAIAYLDTQVKEKTYLGPDGTFVTDEEYPKFVRQELIVNAVTHRAYSITGTDIQIKMFDDHIVVESPGKLPGPVRADNIRFTHFSRNPKIAEFLKNYKFVKEFGEGVNRMCNELEQVGLKDPVYHTNAFMLQAVIYNSKVGKTTAEKTADSLKKLAVAVNKSLIASQKLAIGEEKSAIDDKKSAVDMIKSAIKQQKYNEPSKANILKVYDEIEKNQIFGTKEIKEILDCSPSTARAVMTKLRDMKVVKAVNGKGKGKYVFIE